MKRITLAWALTLCSFITFIACSSPDVGERSVSIIPAPAQMTVGEGTFTIHPGIEIGYADESLKGMGELLSNEIEKQMCIRDRNLPVNKASTRLHSLIINGRTNSLLSMFI